MTGCTGCYDYGFTEGRINAIAVDPTTTTNGSIVAYAATVGGGVWKTTNCCSSSDDLGNDDRRPAHLHARRRHARDRPEQPQHDLRGHRRPQLRLLLDGQPGHPASRRTPARPGRCSARTSSARRTPQPPGQFPQYDAVGKVRVDPNNSNKVVAGTKKGVFVSYNGGVDWTGPCTTNGFPTQRQDITGLELTNMGGGVTRIFAAVGVRGFATTVQYDLGENGANGLYAANMPASGCPTFTSIASNANGFVYGTAGHREPVHDRRGDERGQRRPVREPDDGQPARADRHRGRPEQPERHLRPGAVDRREHAGQLRRRPGLPARRVGDHQRRRTWSFMAGSAGPSLGGCGFDYPQNWYDQGLAVDPNNADRLFVDTYDIWFATRTGSTFTDLTCGYNGTQGRVVHVDQHALAFVNGSSSILLAGSDGGAFSTLNADVAADRCRPGSTWSAA